MSKRKYTSNNTQRSSSSNTNTIALQNLPSDTLETIHRHLSPKDVVRFASTHKKAHSMIPKNRNNLPFSMKEPYTFPSSSKQLPRVETFKAFMKLLVDLKKYLIHSPLNAVTVSLQGKELSSKYPILDSKNISVHVKFTFNTSFDCTVSYTEGEVTLQARFQDDMNVSSFHNEPQTMHVTYNVNIIELRLISYIYEIDIIKPGTILEMKNNSFIIPKRSHTHLKIQPGMKPTFFSKYDADIVYSLVYLYKKLSGRTRNPIIPSTFQKQIQYVLNAQK
jgi:hypothetical protein